MSSNWFAAKSVEQMTVEQSHFEQFTPTRLMSDLIKIDCSCFCFPVKKSMQIAKDCWKIIENSSLSKNGLEYFSHFEKDENWFCSYFFFSKICFVFEGFIKGFVFLICFLNTWDFREDKKLNAKLIKSQGLWFKLVFVFSFVFSRF